LLLSLFLTPEGFFIVFLLIVINFLFYIFQLQQIGLINFRPFLFLPYTKSINILYTLGEVTMNNKVQKLSESINNIEEAVKTVAEINYKFEYDESKRIEPNSNFDIETMLKRSLAISDYHEDLFNSTKTETVLDYKHGEIVSILKKIKPTVVTLLEIFETKVLENLSTELKQANQ